MCVPRGEEIRRRIPRVIRPARARLEEIIYRCGRIYTRNTRYARICRVWRQRIGRAEDKGVGRRNDFCAADAGHDTVRAMCRESELTIVNGIFVRLARRGACCSGRKSDFFFFPIFPFDPGERLRRNDAFHYPEASADVAGGWRRRRVAGMSCVLFTNEPITVTKVRWNKKSRLQPIPNSRRVTTPKFGIRRLFNGTNTTWLLTVSLTIEKQYV